MNQSSWWTPGAKKGFPPHFNSVDNLCHDVFITRQGISAFLHEFKINNILDGGTLLYLPDTFEDMSGVEH